MSITVVKEEQFLNESLGINWISPFIVSDLIPLKALFSIVLIEDGSEISVNEVHPSKAEGPIVSNLFALNIILISDVQLKNE